MIVPAAEAGSNEYYFAQNPRRRFRRWHRDGTLWLVQRRDANGGEPVQFPRILAPQHRPPPDDCDRAICVEWVATLYRDWPAAERAAAIRRILTRSAAR
jgi:hypothetical protein